MANQETVTQKQPSTNQKTQQSTPAHKQKNTAVEQRDWTKEQELDFTYSTFDKIFRLSLGETPIYSCAYFHGDYSKTLQEAQQEKCEFICDSLNIKKGSKVLDMGCGWGGWLKYLQDEVGADAMGVNLSKAQTGSCRQNGLDVRIKDARTITADDYGQFDAVTALGSFEHFCSVSDYKAGRQDEVYQDFFKNLKTLLPKDGRFYMEAMVFGPNMLPLEEFDITAPKDSPQYILALLRKQFPDSWLPYGSEQVIRNAKPHFKLVHEDGGREDYIETNRRWTKLYKSFNWKKYWHFASLIPRYLYDKEFRWNLRILQDTANREAFKRKIFSHTRLVFEKV